MTLESEILGVVLYTLNLCKDGCQVPVVPEVPASRVKHESEGLISRKKKRVLPLSRKVRRFLRRFRRLPYKLRRCLRRFRRLCRVGGSVRIRRGGCPRRGATFSTVEPARSRAKPATSCKLRH